MSRYWRRLNSHRRWSWKKQRHMKRNCLECNNHTTSFSGSNSASSYNNSLMSTHAIQKQRPSNSSGKMYHWCGKQHEWNCPTYGSTCKNCRCFNHFKTVCYSISPAKGAVSPYKKAKPQCDRQASTGSNSVGGGKSKKRSKGTPLKKRQPQQKHGYSVTVEKTVILELNSDMKEVK